jgi:tRNA pseudouridine38-40 synthase
MRIALGIEYDGHEFYGWQAQAGLTTIQGCLEAALSKVADESIQLFCAGRTDAGVHAVGQVVHFDTQAKRDIRAWTLGVNSNLPRSIVVNFAKEVDAEFHARFSARSRCYNYIIYNQTVRSAIWASRVTHYQRPLDADRMHEAAQSLLGEQDFSSFRSSQCESKTPMRCVHAVSVIRRGGFVMVEIEANAFLHHMVRNIVGVLIRIGAGLLPVSAMREILAAKDRTKAFETALPTGLYLSRVTYPDPYQFPFPEKPFFVDEG